MEWNIVTNYKIISEAKKYQHFKVNLGFATTKQQNQERVFSDKDDFAYFYNTRYNTGIYSQGNIGDIRFYTDHYIREDVVAIYKDKEEFIFEFDWDLCREKGVEWYFGSLLKRIDEQLDKEEQRETGEKENKPAEKPVGNPYKLVPGHKDYNPGNVTFEDLAAYKEAQIKGLIKR